MEKDAWKKWGKRFKLLAKANHETLATVAEKMGRTEAALRHWTNGTREINLSEFLELCDKAGVNPSEVLFDAPLMDPEIKSQLGDLAKNVLDAGLRIVPGYQKMAQPPRPKQRA